MVLQSRPLSEAAPVAQGWGDPALVIVNVVKVVRMMLEAGQAPSRRVTVTDLGLSVGISPEKEEDYDEDKEEQRRRGYRPKADLRQNHCFQKLFIH